MLSIGVANVVMRVNYPRKTWGDYYPFSRWPRDCHINKTRYGVLTWELFFLGFFVFFGAFPAQIGVHVLEKY